jgi:hypothetical protein
MPPDGTPSSAVVLELAAHLRGDHDQILQPHEEHDAVFLRALHHVLLNEPAELHASCAGFLPADAAARVRRYAGYMTTLRLTISEQRQHIALLRTTIALYEQSGALITVLDRAGAGDPVPGADETPR